MSCEGWGTIGTGPIGAKAHSLETLEEGDGCGPEKSGRPCQCEPYGGNMRWNRDSYQTCHRDS
jgi:hypothetical protein